MVDEPEAEAPPSTELADETTPTTGSNATAAAEDIEAVAESDPDAIVKLHIDPVDGLDLATARQAAVDAKLPERALDGAADILVKLYCCIAIS